MAEGMVQVPYTRPMITYFLVSRYRILGELLSGGGKSQLSVQLVIELFQ
jgi:hypothetical protein